METHDPENFTICFDTTSLTEIRTWTVLDCWRITKKHCLPLHLDVWIRPRTQTDSFPTEPLSSRTATKFRSRCCSADWIIFVWPYLPCEKSSPPSSALSVWACSPDLCSAFWNVTWDCEIFQLMTGGCDSPWRLSPLAFAASSLPSSIALRCFRLLLLLPWLIWKRFKGNRKKIDKNKNNQRLHHLDKHTWKYSSKLKCQNRFDQHEP